MSDDKKALEHYKEFIEKFTLTEVEELKSKIRTARYSYLITDPYPKHSFYNSLSFVDKMVHPEPEEISIHQAYREGMEFMWSLIEPYVK